MTVNGQSRKPNGKAVERVRGLSADVAMLHVGSRRGQHESGRDAVRRRDDGKHGHSSPQGMMMFEHDRNDELHDQDNEREDQQQKDFDLPPALVELAEQLGRLLYRYDELEREFAALGEEIDDFHLQLTGRRREHEFH